MGGFSDYWEDAVLNHLFGKGGYSAPVIHVGLSRAEPGDDGLALDEPSGGGYARVATGPGWWSNSAGGIVSNVQGVLFDQASSDWGTMTHFALFDSVSGGRLLAWGELVVPEIVNAGDTLEFGVGDLRIGLN